MQKTKAPMQDASGDSSNDSSLRLDEAAIKQAATQLDGGAVTPGYGQWRDQIV